MLKRILFISFILSSCATAQSTDYRYLSLIRDYNELGPKEGPLELLTDPAMIHLAQGKQYDFAIRKGMDPYQANNASRIGIISQDPFWILVRDAVRFPGGRYGAHLRLINPNAMSMKTGAIVLAVNEKNEIALIKNFRHSTRSWEYETPRGSAEKGEDLSKTAARELEEETGLHAESTIKLGDITEASGLIASVPGVFLCRVKSKASETKTDQTEAIGGLEWFSLTQIKEAFKTGSILTTIATKQQRVPFRDPLLGHAIFLAVSHGYLSF